MGNSIKTNDLQRDIKLKKGLFSAIILKPSSQEIRRTGRSQSPTGATMFELLVIIIFPFLEIYDKKWWQSSCERVRDVQRFRDESVGPLATGINGGTGEDSSLLH